MVLLGNSGICLGARNHICRLLCMFLLGSESIVVCRIGQREIFPWVSVLFYLCFYLCLCLGVARIALVGDCLGCDNHVKCAQSSDSCSIGCCSGRVHLCHLCGLALYLCLCLLLCSFDLCLHLCCVRRDSRHMCLACCNCLGKTIGCKHRLVLLVLVLLESLCCLLQ